MKSAPREAPRRERGFTAVELAIAVALSSVILGAAGALFGSYYRVIGEQTRSFRVHQAGMRAMASLTQPLMSADPVGMTPLIVDDVASLAFDPINGQTHDPRVTLSLALAAGENANGSDDNGDGRVDEGTLLLTQSGVSQVLASDVTAVRFTSTATGIEVELEISVISGGELLTQTFRREFTRRQPSP